MEKKEVLKAIEKLKADSPKKKFKQSVDLIINLKDIDLKKTEQQVEFFAHMSKDLGKKVKVFAFVGGNLKDEAAKVCDGYLTIEQFPEYQKDKKKAKRLAEEYDFFIADAAIMAKIAAAFGRVLGPRGKMPNPKAGGVFPPKTNLAALVDKMRHTKKVSIKSVPVYQTMIGKEDEDNELLADNFVELYNQIITHLPNAENNIKSVFLKLTMGPPISIK